MHHDGRRALRQDGCMDDINDDELFLDAVDTIVLDVLQRLGDDPRYAVRLLPAPAGGGARRGGRVRPSSGPR